MNVFGVGTTEIFVVLIIILVLFGPERLPELAKRIGGASREIRDNLTTLNDQMNNALETSMDLDKAHMIAPADTTTPVEPPQVQVIDPAVTTDNKIMPDAVIESSKIPPDPTPSS